MERQFPIMIGYEGTPGPCPCSIPWDVIAPYDGQARVNHQQSLERLAERGGLSPMEAHLVMTGKTWKGEIFTKECEKEACAFLDKIVKDRSEIQQKLDAALLQVRALREACELAVKMHDEFTNCDTSCWFPKDVLTAVLQGAPQKREKGS